MRKRSIPLFILVLLMASCNDLCTRIPKCGNFSFNGTKFDTSSSNGLDMSLGFDFNPGDCGSRCTCNLVCYIQIVRTVDMETFTYVYPSAEKQDRATANGWYIDRLEGKKWGYYGRNDDGSFAGNLIPGSDVNVATLLDGPRRPEDEPWLNIWWQAVSTPVCIQQNSGCENKLLGYYFWSWFASDTGVVNGPIDAIAWQPLEGEVDLAVTRWNAQAPGLGKNNFPAFSRLAP